MDILIHRYLEVSNMPAVLKSLEVLLDHLGLLYKFSDRPITYLYNTLHFYERQLRDKCSLKRKLVGTIINSLKDVRPLNWALTEPFQMNYISPQFPDINTNEVLWNPEISYYIILVRRLIESEYFHHSSDILKI